MNFYNNTHPCYCGIDLHAKSLYVCIIDQEGNTYVHKEIPASPDKLQHILEPYIGNIVVGVECMHCWYWASDFCEDIDVDFILGHALYMKAIHATDLSASMTDEVAGFVNRQSFGHVGMSEMFGNAY